jgi:hypothetical protein
MARYRLLQAQHCLPGDLFGRIDHPAFVPVGEAGLPDREPVIGLTIGDESRAYPLRILMWHEIVNDVVVGVPVAVTFCPLCNTGIVFDRRLDGQVLAFGTILAGAPSQRLRKRPRSLGARQCGVQYEAAGNQRAQR